MEKTTPLGTSVPEAEPESKKQKVHYLMGHFNALYDDRLSDGAKILYWRLLVYAGENGICTPSHKTLSNEVRCSVTQVKQRLNLLRDSGYIIWVRFLNNKTNLVSCSYRMIPQPVAFAPAPEYKANRRESAQRIGGKPTNPQAENRLQKEVTKEVIKEVIDLDCLNRKKRESGVRKLPASKPKLYPELVKLIAEYAKMKKDDPKVIAIAVETLDASQGETEIEVCKCLVYQHNDRGLRWGTENGPYSLQWFPVVVQDYFAKRRKREDSATPIGHGEWEERNATMENKRIM